eukprot:TRINITY_DN1783_c0_g1_i1.p1 TRINITY_DN1783_c0_g1~~TRINITY_DN1783_c0_g1_i1.p1  ORF type:complete len:286 (-),score=56.84 TRINITY_DN1783_c0_g1_i1:49-906(-)
MSRIEKINWPESWVECAGERTIQRRSESSSDVLFYGSWFCPFVQRVWIALEEKLIDYRWVEINPYEIDPTQPGGYTKKALSIDEKREHYPRFIETSPTGLVPGLDNKGESIWDSLIIMEYLDETYPEHPLLPNTPLQRAHQRYWSNFVTEKIQKPYYRALMSQSEDEQAENLEHFFATCREFAKQFAPVEDGPFFLGQEFSMVDVALAPFWQRFLWIGGFYRGLQFPQDEDFDRLNVWWDAVSNRPSVSATFVCEERLISSYKSYADNTGTSNYAKMIQEQLKKN